MHDYNTTGFGLGILLCVIVCRARPNGRRLYTAVLRSTACSYYCYRCYYIFIYVVEFGMGGRYPYLYTFVKTTMQLRKIDIIVICL